MSSAVAERHGLSDKEPPKPLLLITSQNWSSYSTSTDYLFLAMGATVTAAPIRSAGASRPWGLGASERSRLKAANDAAIKKYLKPGVIRDLD
jgi:hypothetical protein